ncbi:hypothetical protein L596_007455 [Steinernema carpocapsae]|uniref:PWWP domain-containing protein n=1 Tax=Steinernema carpocapsae TaxID=34508 RepID=A0A4U5P9E4_STECR|nr:hypothetical protein L596_007455 [Steinernema carpocapsae]
MPSKKDKTVNATVDAIGQTLSKGDLVWASYRKQPEWPAIVKTIYAKKVTYCFLPLRENSHNQIFKGDNSSVRVLGKHDVVPDGADGDLIAAFDYAIKMINDGEAPDRTVVNAMKTNAAENEVPAKPEPVNEPSKNKAKENKAKENKAKENNGGNKKKKPVKEENIAEVEDEALPRPMMETSPPPEVNVGDVVIATSTDTSVAEWPAVVQKIDRKGNVIVKLFPLVDDGPEFRCVPAAVVPLPPDYAKERYDFEIENNASGQSEYIDAFVAVLRHYGHELPAEEPANANGHVEEEEMEDDAESRKRRAHVQGKITIGEAKSFKLRRVNLSNTLTDTPLSHTARRQLTLFEILKSDETQSHLRSVLGSLYEREYVRPTSARFEFSFDAGSLLTYKELTEVSVIALQVVKLHQDVPKMDIFTEMDYLVKVVLPKMMICGIMQWRSCREEEANQLLEASRLSSGQETGEGIEELPGTTMFESLVNAACHELSTNGGANHK